MGLRHGPFTRNEISSLVSDTELEEALARGYLTVNSGGSFSLSELGRAQIKVVLVGGVYDVIHIGHLAALSEAKSFGDVLVAVIASDITVEMLKGRKPIFPAEDRRKLVEELKPVDKAIAGDEDVGMGYEEILTEVKPDVVAFGYDQANIEKSVRQIIIGRKLKIQMVKLSRFENAKFLSSTSVRQKISETLR
jgi:cytidyltransferase-like protein